MRPYYEADGITVYYGDCRELLPIVLPDASQCWLADPPYSSGGFQEAGRVSGSIGKMGPDTKEDRIAADSLSTRGYMNLIRDTLRWSRQAVELGVFTDWRMWTNTADALEYAGFALRAMVVWSKQNNGIGRPWRNQHELVAFGMRAAASKDRVAKYGNVIQCDRSGNEWHPTEKPLELVTKILDNMVGSVIVDPFCGSGTTLRAAKDLQRPAIGIEIEERYCEIAALRLEQGVLDLAAPPEPARKVNGSATEPADGRVMPLYGEPLVGLEPTTAPVSDPLGPGTTAPVTHPSPPDFPASLSDGASKNHPETSTEAQPEPVV